MGNANFFSKYRFVLMKSNNSECYRDYYVIGKVVKIQNSEWSHLYFI